MKTLAILDDEKTRDILSVSWDSSSICNYRCTYCDSSYNDGRHNFPPLEKMIAFLDALERHSGKKLYLEMKGGEPTLWKDIGGFVDICRQRQWGIGLVTNGTRPLPWWEKHLAGFSDVVISLHPESYDYEQILSTASYIQPRRHLCLFMLALPSHFEKIKRDALRFIEEAPTLRLQLAAVSQPHHINGDNELYDYTPEQHEFMNQINARRPPDSGKIWQQFPFYPRSSASLLLENNQTVPLDSQDIKLKGDNRWRGWRCRVGLDRIHISVSGEIFRGQCKQGDSLGNIHTSWQLPTDSVVCEKDLCFCGGELLLQKWDAQKICLERPASQPQPANEMNAEIS